MTVLQPNTMPEWEIHVHFKVHGKGADLFGDGFALWYAKHPNEPGKFADIL